MTKIAVDGRLVQGKLTGVGKFVIRLLEYICEREASIRIIIYSNRKIDYHFRSPGISIKYDKPAFSKLKPMIWSRFFLSRLINPDKVDVFFAGDAFVPLFLRKCRIVSLIHDFNQIIAPETMSTLRLITDKLFYKGDIFKADVILSNSRGTAAKLERFYGRKSDLLVYPILDPAFAPVDQEAVRGRLQQMGVDYPYILSVATLEPRKNLDKTIRAFIALKEKGEIRDHKLLLVGSKGWKFGVIEELISLHKEDVISLGYTPDDAMPYLYSGADVFVFPSSYEGYGMPVREALLCGTKVVCSDLEELREASFNQAVYVDPADINGLASAINAVVKEGKAGPALRSAELVHEDQLDLLIPCLLKKTN